MAVEIDKVKDRIHLSAPFSYTTVDQIKSVGGASWMKSNSKWSLPLDLGTCRRLRETFGDQLKIMPALREWAQKEIEHERQLSDLKASASADLEHIARDAPRLAKAMAARPYQTVGAAYIANGQHVLIADQPGLGKTLETLGGIYEKFPDGGQHLVVSLKTAAHAVWSREIATWTPDAAVYVATSVSKKRREEIIEQFRSDRTKHKFLIVNPEMIRLSVFFSCMDDRCNGTVNGCSGKHIKWYEAKYESLFLETWHSIVIDEVAHNQCSLLAKNSSEKRMTQFRLGATKLRTVDNGLRIGLSGTPMRGKPMRVWGTLNWLRPDVFTAYWKWVERYFTLHDNGYGITIGEMKDVDRFYVDMNPYILRRTKAEVLKDLPPKQYGGTHLDPNDPESPIALWIEMDPAQKKIYNEMAQDATAHMDGGEISATGILAEMTRLRQFANTSGKVSDGRFVPSLPSNKFDLVLEMLEERGISGDEPTGDAKVVIGSQFTTVCNLFARELEARGIRSFLLTGETPDRDRAEIIRRFQEKDDVRVFILNTMAGGVAVTLDRADELFVLDDTFNPDDQEQLEDRIHRASRNHQVTIWNIRSLGTIEEGIARSNMSDDNFQKHLLDGKRGVELLRKILEA